MFLTGCLKFLIGRNINVAKLIQLSTLQTRFFRITVLIILTHPPPSVGWFLLPSNHELGVRRVTLRLLNTVEDLQKHLSPTFCTQ